jgi:hypothetical protein
VVPVAFCGCVADPDSPVSGISKFVAGGEERDRES